MNNKDALKWAIIYRGVSWVTGLLGLALALGPLYFYGRNDLGVGLAIAKIDRAPFLLAPIVLGFLLWQTLSTLTYYKTVSGAVDQQMADRFDPEIIKSDILTTLDERLSDMQSEVQQTRRAVEEANAGPTASQGEADATSFDFQE